MPVENCFIVSSAIIMPVGTGFILVCLLYIILVIQRLLNMCYTILVPLLVWGLLRAQKFSFSVWTILRATLCSLIAGACTSREVS